MARLRHPVPGTRARVTSPFGWRDNPLYPHASSLRHVWHNGLDIGTGRAGDDVVAVAGGEVIAEGWLREPWSTSYGGTAWAGANYGGVMAVVNHGPQIDAADLISVYAHLERTIINVGQRVEAGQRIGILGATGSAQVGGAHLHMTFLLDGHEIDPLPLIADAAETRAQRLARNAARYREVLPRTHAAILGNTRRGPRPGLEPGLDGIAMDAELRESIENTIYRLAGIIGDERAGHVASTTDP